MKLPLLIGGATTSKAHTAVKIAPGYSQPVVHVLDASRAVPVVSSLISAEQQAGVRPANPRGIRPPPRPARRPAAKLLVSLEASPRQRAEARVTTICRKPEFTGVRRCSDVAADVNPRNRLANGRHIGAPSSISLADLVPFIDWSPFFHTWELRGRYPAILQARETRRGSAQAVRRRAETAGEDRRRTSCSSRAASMASSRPTASATTWNSTPTNRAQRC